MEVWAFAITRSTYRTSRAILPKYLGDYNLKIRLFRGVRSIVPFSCFMNALLFLLRLKIKKVKPAFVHARTEYSTVVAALVKPILGFNLIWDARGDTYSEYEGTMKEFPRFLKWFGLMKLKSIVRRIDIASKSCDKAIFISEGLMKLDGEYIVPGNKFVIPCVADESVFFYDPTLRCKAREKLRYIESHVVLAYVGSVAPWQCPNEVIRLMVEVIREDKKYRALIISPNVNIFNKLIPRDLSTFFTVTSCGLAEVNYYLNASDLGVMIRRESPINKVASPVKFAEYSLTGLMVVTNDAVEQVNKYGESLQNLIEPVVQRIIELDIEKISLDRMARSVNALKIYGRKTYNEKSKNIYKFIE